MTFTSRQLVPMALAIAGTYYVTRALLQRRADRAEQRDTRDNLMGRVDDARNRARTTPHVPSGETIGSLAELARIAGAP